MIKGIRLERTDDTQFVHHLADSVRPFCCHSNQDIVLAAELIEIGQPTLVVLASGVEEIQAIIAKPEPEQARDDREKASAVPHAPMKPRRVFASTDPKAAAAQNADPVHSRRQLLRNAMTRSEAPMTRRRATFRAGRNSKSSTAIAAPTYCEMPPSTNNGSGGMRGAVRWTIDDTVDARSWVA